MEIHEFFFGGSHFFLYYVYIQFNGHCHYCLVFLSEYPLVWAHPRWLLHVASSRSGHAPLVSSLCVCVLVVFFWRFEITVFVKKHFSARLANQVWWNSAAILSRTHVKPSSGSSAVRRLRSGVGWVFNGFLCHGALGSSDKTPGKKKHRNPAVYLGLSRVFSRSFSMVGLRYPSDLLLAVCLVLSLTWKEFYCQAILRMSDMKDMLGGTLCGMEGGLPKPFESCKVGVFCMPLQVSLLKHTVAAAKVKTCTLCSIQPIQPTTTWNLPRSLKCLRMGGALRP